MDDAGAGGDEEGIADVAGETAGQVDCPGVAEGADAASGARVQCVEESPRRVEDARVVTACPLDDAAIHLRPRGSSAAAGRRLESP